MIKTLKMRENKKFCSFGNERMKTVEVCTWPCALEDIWYFTSLFSVFYFLFSIYLFLISVSCLLISYFRFLFSIYLFLISISCFLFTYVWFSFSVFWFLFTYFCFLFSYFWFLFPVFCLHLTLNIVGYLIFHLPLHSANKFNSLYSPYSLYSLYSIKWGQIDKTYNIPILGQYSRQNPVATFCKWVQNSKFKFLWAFHQISILYIRNDRNCFDQQE